MRKIADFDLAFTLGHLILKQWVITLMTVVPMGVARLRSTS